MDKKMNVEKWFTDVQTGCKSRYRHPLSLSMNGGTINRNSAHGGRSAQEGIAAEDGNRFFFGPDPQNSCEKQEQSCNDGARRSLKRMESGKHGDERQFAVAVRTVFYMTGSVQMRV
jgi:hypothetical protein